MNLRNFGKKAAIGESIMMMYRITIVSFIALVIFGLSVVFYAHYVDVRDIEAQILAQKTLECVAGEGVLDLDKILGDSRGEILNHCGYETHETERFFVSMAILDSSGVEVAKLAQGDSGIRQAKKFFEKKVAENVKKYRPGGFEKVYNLRIKNLGETFEGSVKMEAFVSDEF